MFHSKLIEFANIFIMCSSPFHTDKLIYFITIFMTQQIKLCPLSGKENLGAMSPSKEMRKLKIELSDKIFELRKIE